MPIGDEAINVFMGLPGEDPRLELTYNHGVDSYELGTGYNHIAIPVDDLDATLERLADEGIEPEKPPYRPGGRTEGPRICFVRDPDGYRIELIGGALVRGFRGAVRGLDGRRNRVRHCLWAVLIVLPSTITALKGRWLLFIAGWLTLGIVWWITAVRLARPRSWWARRFYGPDKLARAQARYGAIASESR